MNAKLLLLLLILPAAPVPDGRGAEESDTDLDMMVRFTTLSPANTAGRYEAALAECERKLAGLPAGTQSLYVAYCYKNMVHALRGLNRKEELDRRIDGLLHDFSGNLPFLAVISMDDLPSTGFWQDHFFRRAEAGFSGKKVYSLERRDRARILRAMSAPETLALAEKAAPRTRALFLRNLVRHLTRIPAPGDLFLRTDTGPMPDIESVPVRPYRADAAPPDAPFPEGSDGDLLRKAMEQLDQLARGFPEDEIIRNAQKDAALFQEELFRRAAVPEPAEAERETGEIPPPPPLPGPGGETWKNGLPDPVVRAAERCLNETGRDAVSGSDRIAVAVLTGRTDRTGEAGMLFSGERSGLWCPFDGGEEKDPAVAAYLLETANQLRKAGVRTGQTARQVAFLERRIRMKSTRLLYSTVRILFPESYFSVQAAPASAYPRFP